MRLDWKDVENYRVCANLRNFHPYRQNSSCSLGSETNSRRTKRKQEDGEAEDNLLSSPAYGNIHGLSKDFQEQFTVKQDEAATSSLCPLRHSCP